MKKTYKTATITPEGEKVLIIAMNSKNAPQSISLHKGNKVERVVVNNNGETTEYYSNSTGEVWTAKEKS